MVFYFGLVFGDEGIGYVCLNFGMSFEIFIEVIECIVVFVG